MLIIDMERILDGCSIEELKDITEKCYSKFQQKERLVISPEKCPAAEAGDGPVVNMSSSPLAANLNILFLSRFDVNIFNQSKLNFWKS